MNILKRIFGRDEETTQEVSEEDDGEITGEYRIAHEKLKAAFEKGDEHRKKIRSSTQTMRAVEPDPV